MVLLILLSAPLFAQTHKVAAPQQNVVRAVGVYEWTGDMAKPTASRLVPITLFIDGHLQDAGVYLARPVPMALLTGNVYELENAGKPLGTLDLAFARHFVAANDASPYDDGWFGYGKFLPPPAEKASTLRASATLPKINAIDDGDDSRPHFSARSATPGSGDAAAAPPGTQTSIGTPADDPDRPKIRKPGTASDDSPTIADPSDPDRPTLRHRPASDAHAAGASPVDAALNDDPNRPTLHRGKPISAMTEEDIPKLSGLPGDADLHHLVAVSDAVTRPLHDFSRAWDDDAERLAILAKMQAAARAQLAAYAIANGAPAAAKPAPTPAPRSTPHAATRNRRPAPHATPAPTSPPAVLLEEQLTGYTLSYGGAATFVYQAHTDGLGGALQFVTIVAQVNTQGAPEFAIQNVTDASHLDRTPRLRLVDAVDAEASNRASLLFELRAQNSRQFALYRILGGRATQTFLTGSTQ